jgi:ketosteroid isomerase-like protein
MTDDEAILAANAAYYRAFISGDFTRMSALWAEEDVSCVHPGWPVLIGRRAILESYRSILRNPRQEPIQPHNPTPLVSGDDGRVFCVEIIGGMALAATNWFRRIDGDWQLIHHQASPIATQIDPEPGAEAPSRRLN